jgi:hypothetical protein
VGLDQGGMVGLASFWVGMALPLSSTPLRFSESAILTLFHLFQPIVSAFMVNLGHQWK